MRRGKGSGGFWFAGDLALDLLAEFEGAGNLGENFGRSAGAPDDNGSVAQEPPESGLFHGDAFDSWQEKFDGATISDP